MGTQVVVYVPLGAEWKLGSSSVIVWPGVAGTRVCMLVVVKVDDAEGMTKSETVDVVVKVTKAIVDGILLVHELSIDEWLD